MNYIENNIDLKNFHLYKNKTSLLNEPDMITLKKSIKENIKPPEKDIKVFVVNFSIDMDRELPLKIIIAGYTLTPKLALILKDGDRSQTFTYTLKDLKRYKFKEKYIGDLINIIKKGDTVFKNMNVPINDYIKHYFYNEFPCNLNLENCHLFKKNKSLLDAVTLKELKKEIKCQVTPPKENTKIFIVDFSNLITDKYVFRITLGQYTLTPKLAVVEKEEDDRVQTIMFTKEDFNKYKNQLENMNSFISELIVLHKEHKYSFAKLGVDISEIM